MMGIRPKFSYHDIGWITQIIKLVDEQIKQPYCSPPLTHPASNPTYLIVLASSP